MVAVGMVVPRYNAPMASIESTLGVTEGLRRRTRLVDDVTAQLRRLILTDQLQPRQQLRQTELAELLGVSRTPLRESFRVLEREGLLRTSKVNNTVEVIDYSIEEMHSLYEVREVLDGLAARLLAERGLTKAESKELGGYLTEMKRAVRPYDRVRFTPAHANFHGRIGELSGNSRVVALSGTIRLTAQMASRKIRLAFENGNDESLKASYSEILEIGLNDHRVILEAIRDRDGRQAETLARRHIRATRKGPLLRPDA